MKWRNLIMMWAVITAFSGCMSQRSEPKRESYLDDKVIAERAENTLHRRNIEAFSHVTAASANGVVYLTGAVPNDVASPTATRLVRKIDGVKDVRNDLVVQ